MADEEGDEPAPDDEGAEPVSDPGQEDGTEPTPAPEPTPEPAAPQAPAATPAVQVTVNQPGAQAQTQGQPAPPQSTSTSASAEKRGVNFGTMDKLAGKTKGETGSLQGDLSQSAQLAQEAARRAESDAQATMAAEADRTVALYKQQQAQADGQAVIAKESMAWAEQEQIAQDQVRNTTHAYAAKLEADLDVVRNMRMQPRAAIENASPGVQRGLAMSAFAQGVLGTKGYHIDAIGAINRSVDQEIRAQEEAIQRGEWLVGQDREMWTMARAEASDQAEARTRLRALKLAAMQADIQAHVSQVGTSLAKADGALTQAKIQTALDDTKTALATQYMNRAVDVHKALLTARLEQARIAVEQQRIASAERIANAKANAKGALTPFISPIAGDLDKEGRPVQLGYFRPGAPKEAVIAVNKAIQGADRIQNAVAAYERGIRALDGDRVIGGRPTRLDSDAAAQVKGLKDQLTAAVMEALPPGERPSQKLWDQLSETSVLLPTETGVNKATAIRAARQLEAMAVHRAQTIAAPYTIGPDGQPLKIGKAGVGGRDYIRSDLTAWPSPAEPGSLDFYIDTLASPEDPLEKPAEEVDKAMADIYKVALDPKNPDSARALEVLKTLASSGDNPGADVSPYLQADAASYLLTPGLVKDLTHGEVGQYREVYHRKTAGNEHREEVNASVNANSGVVPGL